MSNLLKKIKSFSKADAGAAMVEYGIILGVVVAVGGATLLTIGTGTETSLTAADGVVSSAAAAASGG